MWTTCQRAANYVSLVVGRAVLQLFHDGGAMAVSLFRTLRRFSTLPWSHVWVHAHNVANRSFFFVALIMGFTGAIMITQTAHQVQRLLGDLSQVGPAFLPLLVREFGPTITALMLAARCGAGMAAELGAMSVSEQVEAQRMAGAEPWGFLVAPRLLGTWIGIFPVVIAGAVVAYLAGGLVLTQGYAVPWSDYSGLHFVGVGDLAVGLLKTFAFGTLLPLWACYVGLQARRGALDVGYATTRAVIGASVAILAADLLIGGAAYVLGF